MSVGLHENGKVLAINLAGKLTADDYEHFIPDLAATQAGFSKARHAVARRHVRDAGASRSSAFPRGAWERGSGHFPAYRNIFAPSSKKSSTDLFFFEIVRQNIRRH